MCSMNGSASAPISATMNGTRCAPPPGTRSRSPYPSPSGSAARKRVHDADEVMAQITAGRWVEYLERAGYGVVHKPPLAQHGAPGNLAGWIEKVTKSDRVE